MKPDKKICLYCGKELTGKKKYCDDAHRMAFKRQQTEQTTNPNTNKAEQKEPEHANPNKHALLQHVASEYVIRDNLTATDKTFYDRAIKDFKGDPYYRFTDEVKEFDCALTSCGKKFKTGLSLLRYCSYDHYAKSLSGMK